MARTAAAFLLALVCTAAHASAGQIITVGEFLWDDPFGFGPELRLVNYSDAPQFATGDIPSDYSGASFTNLALVVDGAPLVEGGELASGAFLSWLAPPIIEARLSFSFQSTTYSLVFSQSCDPLSPWVCVAPPDEFGEQHAAQLIDFELNATDPVNPSAIPEPGTLILLGSSVALAALRRRSRA